MAARTAQCSCICLKLRSKSKYAPVGLYIVTWGFRRFGAGVTFNGFHIQNVDEFSELRDFITDVAKK